METDYTQHWDEKFRTRSWGRYPPEDLVRFIGRHFRDTDKAAVKIVEVGCGPGANTWFMHREGFAVHGIDVSPAAISIAEARLAQESAGIPVSAPDLRVGNFRSLPWPDGHFDVADDIFALYANTMDVIREALAEIARVLKPGALFYSKLWGTGCSGYGLGRKLEPGTFDDIPEGPCKGMGISHFFAQEEILPVFGTWFEAKAIDVVQRTDVTANQQVEEFHCQFIRAAR